MTHIDPSRSTGRAGVGRATRRAHADGRPADRRRVIYGSVYYGGERYAAPQLRAFEELELIVRAPAPKADGSAPQTIAAFFRSPAGNEHLVGHLPHCPEGKTGPRETLIDASWLQDPTDRPSSSDPGLRFCRLFDWGLVYDGHVYCARELAARAGRWLYVSAPAHWPAGCLPTKVAVHDLRDRLLCWARREDAR